MIQLNSKNPLSIYDVFFNFIEHFDTKQKNIKLNQLNKQQIKYYKSLNELLFLSFTNNIVFNNYTLYGLNIDKFQLGIQNITQKRIYLAFNQVLYNQQYTQTLTQTLTFKTTSKNTNNNDIFKIHSNIIVDISHLSKYIQPDSFNIHTNKHNI